jgi:hypothetical protein
MGRRRAASSGSLTTRLVEVAEEVIHERELGSC